MQLPLSADDVRLLTESKLIVVPLLLASSVLMVLSLPRVAATAWVSLGRQWRTLGVNLDQGDVAAVGVRLLSVLAIVLPLLAVAGVALLVQAWWPSEGRYRPLHAHERGTVFDALPAAHHTPVGLRNGQVGTARNSVWAATSTPPSREHPRLALVLVPRPSSASSASSGSTQATAPAWVFPFNPPRAPGAGDNQALAVNTKDGSTLYDVAFALVWVTDGTALNRNEAYALASCRGCRTVAVGFQVVLIVGQANVVVPQNISAAVNYSCVACVTFALAQQLVLTIPHALSTDAMARLTALWEQIQAFADNIENVPLAQIQTELQKYEVAILGIIRTDLGLTPSGSVSPAAGPSAGSSGDPSQAASGAPGPGATVPGATTTTPATSSRTPEPAVSPGSPVPSSSPPVSPSAGAGASATTAPAG